MNNKFESDWKDFIINIYLSLYFFCGIIFPKLISSDFLYYFTGELVAGFLALIFLSPYAKKSLGSNSVISTSAYIVVVGLLSILLLSELTGFYNTVSSSEKIVVFLNLLGIAFLKRKAFFVKGDDPMAWGLLFVFMVPTILVLSFVAWPIFGVLESSTGVEFSQGMFGVWGILYYGIYGTYMVRARRLGVWPYDKTQIPLI